MQEWGVGHFSWEKGVGKQPQILGVTVCECYLPELYLLLEKYKYCTSSHLVPLTSSVRP